VPLFFFNFSTQLLFIISSKSNVTDKKMEGSLQPYAVSNSNERW